MWAIGKYKTNSPIVPWWSGAPSWIFPYKAMENAILNKLEVV
jgi:hypothetical protein